jgi:hypothetical protein
VLYRLRSRKLHNGTARITDGIVRNLECGLRWQFFPAVDADQLIGDDRR